MLHETRNSNSLLSSLRHDDFLLYSSGYLYTPSNLLSTSTLCSIRISNKEITFLPHLSEITSRTFYLDRDDWWNEIIFDDKTDVLTRRDIVLHVANTDGGAHVDPILKKVYADLVKNNSLGINIIIGQEVFSPKNNPAYAAIRQIGFEFLESLMFNNSEYEKISYPNRSFEMRYFDEKRRFKWSRTDITISEETRKTLKPFDKKKRKYFVYKPKDKSKKGHEVIIN